MDSYFDEILNVQYQRFKKRIMSDYVQFNKMYSDKSGFPFLELSSREYELQKFFEVRVEDYIRNILVNDVLCIALKNKGIDVYRSEISKIYSGRQTYFSNVEYEKIAFYEFIVGFDDKSVMYRYTDIETTNDNKLLSDFTGEIVILDWSIPGHLTDTCRKTVENGKSKIICLYNFFEEYLGIEEYERYIRFLVGAVIEFQEFIGVMSVPKLSPYVMGAFRFEVERNFVEHIKKIENLYEADKNILKTNQGKNKGILYGYQIIDDENRERFATAEIESKELLIKKGKLKLFKEKKLYRYFIGKSDFSRSYMTSEYLFKQYDADDCFDYTAIVSGYLKSIEQLLFHIAKFSINKGYKIRNRGLYVDKEYKNKRGEIISKKEKPPYIVWSFDNLQYADTTIGALIGYFKFYKDKLFNVDSEFADTVIFCLDCYRIECRNDSFHLDNNYKWSRVEFIRWNTVFLYIILLSCCKLGDSEIETINSLQVISNDKVERVYDLISRDVSQVFDFYFCDENGALDRGERVVYLSDQSDYPSYNNYGLITSAMLVFENTDSKEKIFISKHNIPEEAWWINDSGERFLIE